MSLADFLTDTVDITDADGTAVATAEPCRLNARSSRSQVVVLDGMLHDDQPRVRLSFTFGAAASVAEFYRLSGLVYGDGTTDDRRFVVQSVIQARGRGGADFLTAYCKVA